DSLAQPGRALLKSLMRGAALRGETVHVFHWEMSRAAISAGLVPDIASRLVHHDCFSDPLGWTGSDALIPETPNAPNFPHAHGVVDLRAAVGGASGPDRGPLCVVLDSLSPLLLHAGWPRVLSRLRALADRRHDDGEGPLISGVQVRQVVALLHGDAHAEGSTADAVRHAASTVLTLTPAPPRAFTHVRCRHTALKANFTTTTTNKITHKSRLDLYIEGAMPRYSLGHGPGNPTTWSPVLTRCSLGFITRTHEAKDENLPCLSVFCPHRKQDLLTPGGSATPTQIGGGRIFYCPDDADDVDDEDPDDDLDI
uniref:Elongator complex protein 5 n=1 Tax=Petromyzon marinus TaxID=7757 RepID=S4RVJ7_PETMA